MKYQSSAVGTYLNRNIQTGYKHPFIRAGLSGHNVYYAQSSKKYKYGMNGGSFFGSLGKFFSSVAPSVISAVAPLALQAGKEIIGQKTMSKNPTVAKIAEGALKGINFMEKNKESLAPLAGTASSLVSQKLSDRGHDNAANLISQTSQQTLQKLLNQNKGQGIRGLNVKRGRGMNNQNILTDRSL